MSSDQRNIRVPSKVPVTCTKCNKVHPFAEASSNPYLGWICCDATRQCAAAGTEIVHCCLECHNLIMDWEEQGRSYRKHICNRCLSRPAPRVRHRYENEELCMACVYNDICVPYDIF